MQSLENETASTSALQVYRKTNTNVPHRNKSSFKMIGLHTCAFIMTSAIFFWGGYIVFYLGSPLLSYLYLCITNVLFGTEKGTTCKHWNATPWEQLQCKWTNYINDLMMSAFNSVLYEINSIFIHSRWSAFIAYGCAVFRLFLYLKDFATQYGYHILLNIGVLYRKLYNIFDNLHIFLTYVDNVLHCEND